MKVKSFGCSFVFGNELPDVNEDNGVMPSKLTWPALVANHLNMEYLCYAKGGAGNLLILNRLLNHISFGEKDFYIINWTWIDRFDYVDVSAKNNNDWVTLLPNSTVEIADTYYKYLQSELRDKLTTLSYIQLAINTLEKKGCPFIMTFMDKILLDQTWHVNPGVIELQNSVFPYLSTFNGYTFLDWSKNYNYPISSTLHPLQQAHSAAADLIVSNLDDFIKNKNSII